MPRGKIFAFQTGALGRLFCFLLALSVSAPLFADTACAVDWETQSAQVRRVVDGDTLLLQSGERVRLVGADAPELGRDGRPDQPFAVAAREHLDMLVTLNAGRVILAIGPEARDRYGRLLAIVSGERHGDFTAHLLRNGLALAVAVPPNTDGFACHLAAERAARAARQGLWRADPVVAASDLQRTGFFIIRGRAGAWRTRNNDHLLELDGALTLRLRKADLDEWFAGAPLANYAGRMLEVRGWVHPWGSGRFAITVQHPATIEILDDTTDDL
jgi:endonuclease YncB( thermonuclease family)